TGSARNLQVQDVLEVGSGSQAGGDNGESTLAVRYQHIAAFGHKNVFRFDRLTCGRGSDTGQMSSLGASQVSRHGCQGTAEWIVWRGPGWKHGFGNTAANADAGLDRGGLCCEWRHESQKNRRQREGRCFVLRRHNLHESPRIIFFESHQRPETYRFALRC